MKAANGRSLKVENPDLERAVGKLFDTRNGVAHRREMPTTAEATECTNTAESVFEWLRTFEPD